eukprot:scaffold68316_cov59-Phaeocystis_antarctica.AAC.4
MQPLSRRSASNRTSTGGCGLVRRKRIARRVAGDPEEKTSPPTVLYYTNNATCSCGVPTERRLLFGAQPQAGVCVPT